MLTALTNFLTALLQKLKQEHLTTSDYQKHLLYERLQKGIDEDIDRIKEIALACGYSETIADAHTSLIAAADILKDFADIETLEKETIKTITQIIEKLNDKNETFDGVFNQYTAKEAIINMCGDIAEKRTRDLYLLRFGGAK